MYIYIYKFRNTAKNFKYPSKDSGRFCSEFENSGLIILYHQKCFWILIRSVPVFSGKSVHISLVKSNPYYRPILPRGWVEVQLNSSQTAALEGGEWSAASPSRTLPPGKTRYPFYRRLGGPQGRSGRAENLVPTGIRSRTSQPVVSRYTD